MSSEAQRLGGDRLRPPGGEQWDDERYERLGLTRDHVSRMWARYVDQTQPPPPHIANLIIGVTSDVHKALAQQADGGTAVAVRKACANCDDTGDVTSIDGEWRGVCHCPAGNKFRTPPTAPQALTEEQINRLVASSEVYQYHPGALIEFVREIEAAHGISAAGINKKGE
jgi:hypothetical protein